MSLKDALAHVIAEEEKRHAIFCGACSGGWTCNCGVDYGINAVRYVRAGRWRRFKDAVFLAVAWVATLAGILVLCFSFAIMILGSAGLL